MSDDPLGSAISGGLGGGVIGLLIVAIFKIIREKGIFCQTPCGSFHDCIIDVNDGRPEITVRSGHISDIEGTIASASTELYDEPDTPITTPDLRSKRTRRTLLKRVISALSNDNTRSSVDVTAV